MTNFADVLTVLAAGGGLAVMLIMAAVPLLLDRHGSREREEPDPVIRGPRRTDLSLPRHP